jgi:hypothetical protein
MILWLTGPFGIGKTQAAYELRRRLPGSFIVDPEEVGFVIRKLTPPHKKRLDFQDYPLWREMVTKILLEANKDSPHPIIVPMTLVNPVYFQEIIGNLRQADVMIVHTALIASQYTLLKRLKQRGDNAASWGARQIDRCLSGLNQLDFADLLQTDDMSISEVAEYIARRASLSLQPRESGLRQTIHRLSVQWNHIRQ